MGSFPYTLLETIFLMELGDENQFQNTIRVIGISWVFKTGGLYNVRHGLYLWTYYSRDNIEYSEGCFTLIRTSDLWDCQLHRYILYCTQHISGNLSWLASHKKNRNNHVKYHRKLFLSAILTLQPEMKGRGGACMLFEISVLIWMPLKTKPEIITWM